MTDEQKQKLAKEYVAQIQWLPSGATVDSLREWQSEAFFAGLNCGLDECQKLTEALKYIRNEMEYRLYQIEEGLKHDDWSHIKMYGEMIRAIEIADNALQHTSQKDET